MNVGGVEAVTCVSVDRRRASAGSGDSPSRVAFDPWGGHGSTTRDTRTPTPTKDDPRNPRISEPDEVRAAADAIDRIRGVGAAGLDERGCRRGEMAAGRESHD